MQPVAERFIKHVDKSGECWLWTAHRMKNGYGTFRMPDRHYLAHRIAYALFRGAVVDGLDVMHSCDNPGCVNPDHLSLGTRADNMRDASTKGRTARGERHGRARLSWHQAQAIIALAEPQAAIAARFGISQSTVSQIKSGRRWNHLQPAE